MIDSLVLPPRSALFSAERVSQDATPAPRPIQVKAKLGPTGLITVDETRGVKSLFDFSQSLTYPEVKRIVWLLDGKVTHITATIETPASLPLNRLPIADLFPDETVEFSFATLTPADRSATQKACFKQADEAIAKRKAADDKAAADKVIAEQASPQKAL